MSLVPLQIQHAAGTRTLPVYTVPLRTRPHEAAAERTRGGRARVRGDQLERPSQLVVITEVPAANLPAAYALAYTIVTEAATATIVTTHEGDTPVLALLGYEMRPHPSSVVLALRWAAARGDERPTMVV